MKPFEKLSDEWKEISKFWNLELEWERKQALSDENPIFALGEVDEITYIYGNVWKISFVFSPNERLQKEFREGDTLYFRSEEESFVGVLVLVQKSNLIAQVRGDIQAEGSFKVQKWFSEFTYNCYQEWILSLQEERYKRKEKYLGWMLGYNTDDKPIPKRDITDSIENQLLYLEDYGVVFGPPGTGKTALLMKTIEKCLQKKERILVLCQTNFACDLIVEKSNKLGWKVTRLGNSYKLSKSSKENHIDHKISQHKDQKQIQVWLDEWKRLIKKIKTWKRSFGKEDWEERKALKKEAKDLMRTIRAGETNLREEILSQSDVVVSTFVGIHSEWKKGIEFDRVFVDEATQAPEPCFLLSFFLGKSVYFFGDPKQLPPTLLSPEGLVRKSFLERAIESQDPSRIFFLPTQYRMHPKILGFSNEFVYEGKVDTAKERKERILEPFAVCFGSSSSLVWIDTAGSDTEEVWLEAEQSFWNPTEISLLKSLSNLGLLTGDSQIISPYSAQVEALRSEGFSNANTIDSFQGREADLILISFVRSNQNRELGFLTDIRRLNVALTRARHHLVLIGDSITLTNANLYANLYSYAEKEGEIRSIFEFMD